MDHSAITCDKIIYAEAKSNDKLTKTFPTNFDKKSYNTQNFYSSFTLSLIIIALLIAANI